MDNFISKTSLFQSESAYIQYIQVLVLVINVNILNDYVASMGSLSFWTCKLLVSLLL